MVNSNYTTTEKVKEYFNDDAKIKTVIVNVLNEKDYVNVLNSTTTNRIRISNFFCSDAPFPDSQNMLNEILKLEEPKVILGYFHFLAFNNKIDIRNSLRRLKNYHNKVLILTYGHQIRDILNECIDKERRFKDDLKFMFIDGVKDPAPEIMITNKSIKSATSKYKYFDNLKDYFIELENKGTLSGVVRSDLEIEAFKNGIWNVSKISFYNELCNIDTKIRNVEESFGNEDQWYSLFKKLIDKRSIRDLFDKNIIEYIKDFDKSSPMKKFQILLLLKITDNNGYLGLISKANITIDNLIANVYDCILDIDSKNKSFNSLYNERKELIKLISNDVLIKNYVEKIDSTDISKIYYLTDNTISERMKIISFFNKSSLTTEKIIEITKDIYPEFAGYLRTFNFNMNNDKLNTFLTIYFDKYKSQKVKNQIDPSFIKTVDEQARSTNKVIFQLEARANLINEFKTTTSKTYFIDGMGMEYASLIQYLCNDFQLNANIKFCRAELPTLTEFNEFKHDVKYDELDNLNHDSKVADSTYIAEQISIISNILKTIMNALKYEKIDKIILTSDHGTSRLAKINTANHIINTSDFVEKKSTHGGRCCSSDLQILSNCDIVLKDSYNDHWVVANYHRINNSNRSGVELHGGATIEEVLIPVIEITKSTDNINIEYSCEIIFPDNKNKEYSNKLLIDFDPFTKSYNPIHLVIRVSDEVKDPYIIVKNLSQQRYKGTCKKNTDYEFLLDITKISKYNCDLYDGSKLIIPNIKFDVVNKVAFEHNLFD
ncbi:MAG: BREX-4 system phosphatase PglZ [Christensenellaceae bacterium]|jgi:hypothetical protein|nr:BREX-4 system phosphatase PglZ [Christensenellaceae bacterium]